MKGLPSNYLLTLSAKLDEACLNLDDLGEKSAQIPLMTEIYPKAICVYIWLGPEDEFSRGNRPIKNMS